jgi:hypothetical protein
MFLAATAQTPGANFRKIDTCVAAAYATRAPTLRIRQAYQRYRRASGKLTNGTDVTGFVIDYSSAKTLCRFVV